MSAKEKLLKRLLSRPKDFTFDEAATLFGYFGYVKDNSGRTSGSAVKFIKGERRHSLHRPHPSKELKSYAVKQLVEFFEEEEND